LLVVWYTTTESETYKAVKLQIQGDLQISSAVGTVKDIRLLKSRYVTATAGEDAYDWYLVRITGTSGSLEATFTTFTKNGAVVVERH
jgi:hypothetical protein